MGAAGTRERIIAANRYNPNNAAKRVVRERDGRIETRKKAGDFILTAAGTYKVKKDCWN